jgi:uncharacterized protein (DUF2267 family)
MDTKVNFEKNCNEAISWINEISIRAGFPSRPDWAYSALKSVLHSIRDRSTIEEIFQFAAQLPLIIKGIFFEGYNPSGKPVKLNSEEFMMRIRKDMGTANEIPAGEAFRVVLELLYEKTSTGEMNQLRGLMPKDIQKLWDKAYPQQTPSMH